MRNSGRHITCTKLFLFLLPVLLAWGLMWYFIVTSPVRKFIDKNNSSYFVSYSDTELHGHSTASAALVNDTLVFTYQLKEGYAWPYVGFCFIPSGNFIKSLKGQNYMHLHMSAKKGKVIPISIYEYVPGYSDTLNNRRIRRWTYNIKLQAGNEDYKIAFSDFEVPIAWEKENQISNKSLPEFSPERIRTICIQNCILIDNNDKDEIRIAFLNIERDYQEWISGLQVFSGIWFVAGFLFVVIQRKKTSVFIPYIATETKSEGPGEWDKIQAFISVRYMEALDMDLLEKKLGIARHKIAALIKENTSLLFKQYLNRIRIAEAKRLLVETNLPIGEVADKVGFGHISNFNRVFKEYTGQSPSDLRKDLCKS